MAEGGSVDLASEDETAKLLQFQELTGLESDEHCREILARHGWDMEMAVQDTFNEQEGRSGVYNEPESNVRQRIPSPPPLVNYNSVQSSVYHTRRSRNEPRLGWLAWGAHWLVFPFRFIYSTLFDLLRFFWNVFRPDPRRMVTDPSRDVENFIDSFNAKYGTNHPTFYRGAYAQALNDAKQELKFLIVYLHGDDHQDTDSFCNSTLCNDQVRMFVNNGHLFWTCNVNSPEGYRVSQALRENTYPFLAVIVLKDSRMTVVGRLQGAMGAAELVSTLRDIMNDNEMYLIAARTERDEHNLSRSIREEQDAAYLESERQDREKERQRREEAERRRQEEELLRRSEEEREARVEDLQRKKERWRCEIPQEPGIDCPDCIRIVIKLPNNTRLERRFLRQESLKYLYYFVFCHQEAPHSFDIVTSYPRKSLPCLPTEGFEPPTFAEVGLGRSEMLIVQDHDA